ncbi:hypothetical protein VTN49DRAFT_8078 [Thermomyces lanuginosus]|uniref:uncharacterized protein n=1 Tax=Thermomyces lanuginosus TaxID=5541 RepID=UPI00374433F9
MEEEAKFIMEAEPEYRYYSDTEKNGKSYIYYPICLGEVLNGRYQIEHKLGHGRFSTVWMAHDLRDKKDVALKIMATTRDGKSPGEHEMRIHDEIRQIPGVASDRLVTYLDTFVVSTSNGRNHRVLVLPFLAPCPDIVALGKLSMATRMSAAKQLLEALEALHTAGIVHRDLRDDNCLWGISPLRDLPRHAKYDLLGWPVKRPIPDPLDESRKQPKPGEIVLPLEVPDHLRTDQLYLSDFSLAMHVDDTTVPQMGFPPEYFCSPDRLHLKHPSLACDMWSYMVIFSQLYVGCSPFGSLYHGGVIQGMIYALGPLPKEWKGQYINPEVSRDWWYDPNTSPDPKHSLASLIEQRRPDADAEERKLVLSIMMKVFRAKPTMDANPEIQVVWRQAARGAWLNRNAKYLQTTPEQLEATTERLAMECAVRHRAQRAMILAAIHATTRDAGTGMIKEDDRHLTIRLWPQKRTVHTYVRYTDGEPIPTATAVRDTVMEKGENPVEIWSLDGGMAGEDGGDGPTGGARGGRQDSLRGSIRNLVRESLRDTLPSSLRDSLRNSLRNRRLDTRGGGRRGRGKCNGGPVETRKVDMPPEPLREIVNDISAMSQKKFSSEKRTYLGALELMSPCCAQLLEDVPMPCEPTRQSRFSTTQTVASTLPTRSCASSSCVRCANLRASESKSTLSCQKLLKTCVINESTEKVQGTERAEPSQDMEEYEVQPTTVDCADVVQMCQRKFNMLNLLQRSNLTTASL